MLSAAITDLTARVERVDAQLRERGDSTTPTELEGRLQAVESVLTSIRKTVTTLAAQHAEEEQQRELRQPWHLLTAAQAERRWLDLRDWVDWFVARNSIGAKEVPNCWYLHDGLVDELEALRWAWIDTNKPAARGVDPIWWREALHRARGRWPLFNVNGCAKTHSEPSPRVMGGEREWENFLAEDLAKRPATAHRRAS